jgi:zinc protease
VRSVSSSVGSGIFLAPLAALLAFGTLLTPAAAHADDPAAAVPHAPPLPVKVAQLANGLEVILHEDHRTPIAAVNIWYHVGSKDEAPGKSGFAHLFEHVMFQGSKHVPEDTYLRYLERAGATDANGATHTDRTAYYETVPSNRLELALWLESDRMGFLLAHVDGQTFAVQRDVVRNERRQNYESVAYGLVGSIVRAAVYPVGHPYHEPAIGNAHDLDTATLNDVRQFFVDWYLPRNAVLVIAGDIDPDKTMALVQKYFAPIASGDVPERRAVPAVVRTAETHLDVRAGVELGRTYVTWSTPAFFAPGDGELDLIARALAGGKSSRLYRRLVYDLRIAEDVTASQASSELGSMFEIVATAQPGHTPSELLAAIDAEMDKVRATPIADDELARAKTALVASRIFSLERVASQADLINTYTLYEPGAPEGHEMVGADLARYDAVTPATLRDAAARYLPAHARVVTFVTPTPGAPVCGELAAPSGATSAKSAPRKGSP